MTQRHQDEQGSGNSALIAIVGLAVLTVVAGVLAIWAYANYREQKTDVDGKITLAEAAARREQATKDEAQFREAEKKPFRLFAGPDDYGHLTFNYPKTWSVYVADAAADSGDSYQAYLNPGSVPSTDNSDTTQYALRVTIAQQAYNDVISTYEDLVSSGDLHSAPIKVGGTTGTRLDGKLTDDIRGSAVIFKLRDKTVTLQTDADTFKPDFNKIISSVKFNS